MSPTIIQKPETKISEKLLREIKTQTEEMGQVVLHFVFHTPPDTGMGDTLIRIWPTSYLYDLHSSHKSELIHIENITYYPVWYLCPAGTETYFTLIFSGLPKSCTAFDFIEHCTNQSGAFEVRNIQRNKSDVYFLQL
ncbi:MAG: hypothetical protein AAGA77_22460 [Bacteroidota bacterium]